MNFLLIWVNHPPFLFSNAQLMIAYFDSWIITGRTERISATIFYLIN